MTFTTHECYELAEAAYRRGYYQGAEAVIAALMEETEITFNQVCRWHACDLTQWQHGDTTKRTLPPAIGGEDHV